MSFLRKSLRARLVVYFMLLSLVTVSLVVATAFWQARSAFQTAAFDRLHVAATLKEDALTQWVADQRQDVLLMAQLPALVQPALVLLRTEPDDPAYQAAYQDLKATVATAAAHKPAWHEVLLLSAEGQVRLSTVTAHEGDYRTFDQYFTQGQLQTVVQHAHLLPETLKPAITIATPLSDEVGGRQGVLAIHLNLERMDTIVLERTGLSVESESYLVDPTNAFLSSERFGRAAYPRGVSSEGIEAALQGRDGAGLYTNYRGIPVIGVYHWVDDLQVALLVELPAQVALAAARRLALTILLVGLSIALVLTAGMYLLARQIARPILRITDTALQIADGTLTARAPVTTDDEIGILARTFNEMTQRLRLLYDDLDQEITERKQIAQALRDNEERYRTFVAQSTEGIWRTEVDVPFAVELPEDEQIDHLLRHGYLAECNDAYAQMYGYDSAEAIIGKRTTDFLSPANPEHVAFLRAFIQSGYRIIDVESTEMTQHGALRHFSNSLIGSVEDGLYRRAWGTQRDITERKQHQAERERLIADLEAKNAELERFTYTVSHDLKTPLVTINGFLGLLEKDAVQGDIDRMQRDMQQIKNATEQMQRLLAELLDLSRIGRLVNPPEAISMTALAEDAVRLATGTIEARGVTVEIDPAMPVVLVDRVRLFEVFQNLIENAIKFMGDQPQPHIEIGARHTDDAVIFFVRDNGIGIAPRYHEQVFGLFNRLDAGSEGTGIGLALVKRIVEVHGGRIWVESEGPGNGSTFCFTLPLAPNPVAPSP